MEMRDIDPARAETSAYAAADASACAYVHKLYKWKKAHLETVLRSAAQRAATAHAAFFLFL